MPIARAERMLSRVMLHTARLGNLDKQRKEHIQTMQQNKQHPEMREVQLLTGFSLFYRQKTQSFSGLSKTPLPIFQDLFRSPQMFKYNWKVSIKASKASRKNCELLYAVFK